MCRRGALITVMVFNLVFSGLAFTVVPSASAASITVCPDGPPFCGFTSIAAAVAAASNGDTIFVAPGEYREPEIVVDKQLTFIGPNAGVNPNTGVRGPEAVVMPDMDDPASRALFVLAENTITIDGFVLDGHDPLLPASPPDVSFNNVRISAAFGVVNDGTHVENQVVRNNKIQNLNYGVYLFNTTNIPPAVPSTIANNLFDNLSSRDGSSIAVALQYNAYASVTGNVMTRVYIGIYADQFYTGGSPVSLSNNTISSYRFGIWSNGHSGNTSNFTIADNTITTADYATWTSPGALPPSDNRNIGVSLTFIQQDVGMVVVRNNVSGANVGIYGFNVVSSREITVNGGTLANNNYGVQLAACDANLSQYPIIVPFTPPSRLTVRDLTITDASVAGLAVINDPTQDPVNCGTVQPVRLTGDNVRVTGPGSGSGASGALVRGGDASLTLTGSTLTGNGVGLRINGATNGTVLAKFNVIVANGMGVNVAAPAPTAANLENNWWGCNEGPGSTGQGCDTVSGSGPIDFDPWLTLRISRTPGGATAVPGDVFNIVADLIINSDSVNTSATDTVQDGTPIAFAVAPAGGGTITPASAGTVNGVANATFTAGNLGGATTISATSDDETVTTSLVVNVPPPAPSPVASVAPTILTFGSQTVGTTSAAQPVTLTNPGGAALAIGSITASDDFAQTNNCGSSLPASASCTINVTFTPTVAGGRNGTLTLTDNAAGSPRFVPLGGTGAAPVPSPSPVASAAPASLTFANQTLGTTSAAQPVTLSNTGTAPLTINVITVSGDFAQTNNCGSSLAAGTSCTINVTFTPVVAGARGGNLTIFDNAAGSPRNVALGGTGAATASPSPSPSPSPSASPSPSPSPSPIMFTVAATTIGSGTINPGGTTSYAAGTQASYTATAGAGQVFLGWTLDGVYVGYASPLTFAVNGNRSLVARFAARPTFSDVPAGDADFQAITFLAALGIVNPAGVNGSGRFEPNREVARAEMAAFIARVFGWDDEFHASRFPDKCDPQGQNCIDDELWNNVAALADYGVVGGYTDPQTCAAAGTDTPCYLPRDPVKRVQVVSIVARAFIKAPDLRPTGFWDRLDANAGQYTNVPDTGTQRTDLTTYRANAGPVPGQASDSTFPNPEGNAMRRFVIQVLFQAFNSQFSVDRVP